MGYLTEYHRPQVGGVISSFGNRYDWDKSTVSIVRVATVVGSIFTFPLVPLVYFVMLFFKDS